MNNSFFLKIGNAVEQKGETSPFLFLSENSELLQGNILAYLHEIMKEHGVDSQSLFHFADDGESVKIKEIKEFISQGEVRPRFAFQIFLIENISRMTHQAQNACLKFFEEPGQGNIIILTDSSRAGILETILSRVQIYELYSDSASENRDFYISMIRSYSEEKRDELIRYYFSEKHEKQEYTNFLYALIDYIAQSGLHVGLLDEIHRDLKGLEKNNLSGKYIVDKYILEL